jgi:hypothetical protein
MGAPREDLLGGTSPPPERAEGGEPESAAAAGTPSLCGFFAADGGGVRRVADVHLLVGHRTSGLSGVVAFAPGCLVLLPFVFDHRFLLI